MSFIPGLCRIWCRKTTGDNRFWQTMSYPGRGYHDCLRIVEDYQDRFGNLYQYEITANLDVCRPSYK